MSILAVTELRQLFDPSRIEQLATDFTGQHGDSVYNPAIVQGIIEQTEGIVKNTLSLQYTTLQLEADAGIKRIVADITMYYLELRRPPVSSVVVSLHENALRLLGQLQDGSAKLAAVAQLLPIGPTEEPTEATDSGYFD